MKKWISLLLCIAFLLCFAGCGAEDAPAVETTQSAEDGIREQHCPICNKTVKWMGLTQAYVDTINVKNEQ